MAMRIFLANLEKIRKFNNWSMEEMYERLDFGKSSFHNWKHGKSKPSLSMLEQIARNAGITPSDLLRKGFVPKETDVGRTEKFFEQCRRINTHLRIMQAQFQTELSDILPDLAIMEKMP